MKLGLALVVQWTELLVPVQMVGGSTPLEGAFTLVKKCHLDIFCKRSRPALRDSDMKREFSAGGIVFNKKGQVLLTKHSQNHHWSFPKGLIDPGQTPEQSAVREVR